MTAASILAGSRGRRRAAGVLLCSVALAVLGACGDGDGDVSSRSDDSTATGGAATDGSDSAAGGGRPASEEGLEDAARSYAEALLDGDYAVAYEFLTEECQEELPRDTFDGFVDDAIDQVESEAEGELSELENGEVRVKNVTDRSGEVSVELIDVNGEPLFEEPDFDEWVYEDGDWHLGGCFTSGTDEDTLDTAT